MYYEKYSKIKGALVLPVPLLPWTGSQKLQVLIWDTDTHVGKQKETFQALGKVEILNDSDFF